MNYRIRLFLITSLFALSKCQDTPGTVIKGDDSVDCYNYGIKDNCELPFGKDNEKITKCEKACVKFDGYAKDGERIVVGNCGYFTGDESLDEDEDELEVCTSTSDGGTSEFCKKSFIMNAPLVN